MNLKTMTSHFNHGFVIRLLLLSAISNYDVTAASCVADEYRDVTYSQFLDCEVNYEDMRYFYATSSARSVLECSRDCSNAEPCLGFTYTEKNGNCNLSDMQASSCSDLSVNFGSRYYFKKTGMSDCALSWKLIYETDEMGPTKGNSDELKDYVITGSKVRLQIPTCDENKISNFAMFTADSVTVTSIGLVRAEVFTFWDGVWSLILVESYGYLSIQPYNSDLIPCDLKTYKISWFVKPPMSYCSVKPVTVPGGLDNGGDVKEKVEYRSYSNPMITREKGDGLFDGEKSLDLVELAVKDGFTFQVVQEEKDPNTNGIDSIYHSFTLNDFSVDGNTFTAKALWVAENFMFSDFTMKFLFYNRDGAKLTGSQFQGVNIARPELYQVKSNVDEKMSWYGDFCWEKIYETDNKGLEVFGSVKDVIRAVQDYGSQIRVSYTCNSGDYATYIHSNVKVSIRSEKRVIATSELSVIEANTTEDSSGPVTFTRFYWQQKEVETSGIVYVYLTDLEKTTQWLDKMCYASTKWFVDKTKRRKMLEYKESEPSVHSKDYLGTTMVPMFDQGRLPNVGFVEKGDDTIMDLYSPQLLLYAAPNIDRGNPSYLCAIVNRNLEDSGFLLLFVYSYNSMYGIEKPDLQTNTGKIVTTHDTQARLTRWFL